MGATFLPTVGRIPGLAGLLLLPVLAPASLHAWTWAAPSSTPGKSLWSAAYAPTLDRTVAVGSGDTVLVKSGRDAWQVQPLPDQAGFSCVVWTGSDFVAAGASSIAVSATGESWQPVPGLGRGLSVPRIAAGGGLVAVLAGREVLLTADPRRVRWTKARLPVVRSSYGRGAPFYDITHGRGTFVAVGSDGYVATSIDGRKWATRPRITGEDLQRVVFDGARFVASGRNTLITSTDGAQWTALAEPPGWQDGFVATHLVFSSGGDVFLEWLDEVYRLDAENRWQPFGSRPREWIPSAGVFASAPDGRGHLRFFGGGGRVYAVAADGSSWTPEIEPGGPAHFGSWGARAYETFTGYLGRLFASDAQGDARELSPVAGRWQELGAGLPHPDRPVPRGYHRTREGVVSVTTQGFYLFRGGLWTKLGPLPVGHPEMEVIGLAESPQKIAVALLRDDHSYRVYHAAGWSGWRTAQIQELPVTRWDESAAGERVQHDGQRFLLLAGGVLYFSDDGAGWTPLPPLPDDTAEYLATVHGGDAPPGNDIFAFASNGSRLLAASVKWASCGEYCLSTWVSLARFFYYDFAGGRWDFVPAPDARSNTRDSAWTFNRVPPVLWNDDLFFVPRVEPRPRPGSPGYAYTSGDGLDWFMRQVPAHDISHAVWTGSHFAVVTASASVMTHPTGLTREAGSKPQTISFRLPPKIHVGRNYRLGGTSRSKLPVFYVVDDPAIAEAVWQIRGRNVSWSLRILRPGRTRITAYQSGGDDWQRAEPVPLDFEAVPGR